MNCWLGFVLDAVRNKQDVDLPLFFFFKKAKAHFGKCSPLAVIYLQSDKSALVSSTSAWPVTLAGYSTGTNYCIGARQVVPAVVMF